MGYKNGQEMPSMNDIKSDQYKTDYCGGGCCLFAPFIWFFTMIFGE